MEAVGGGAGEGNRRVSPPSPAPPSLSLFFCKKSHQDQNQNWCEGNRRIFCVQAAKQPSCNNNTIQEEKEPFSKKECLRAPFNKAYRLRDVPSRNFAWADEVEGGSFEDCLSASDIDSLLRPVIPAPRWLSAMELYLVRTGRSSAVDLSERIVVACSAAQSVIAPLHVRHHWVLAIFSSGRDGLRASVVDSAPSSITERDIRHLMWRLRVDDVSIRCWGKQPRDSNECGVHTVVNAWREFFGAQPHAMHDEVSLSHLRPVLARLATDVTALRHEARVIARDPRRLEVGVCGAGPGGGASFDPPPSSIAATSEAANEYKLTYLLVATQLLDRVAGRAHLPLRRLRTLFDLEARLFPEARPIHGVERDLGDTVSRLVTRTQFWPGLPVVSFRPGRDAAPILPDAACILIDELPHIDADRGSLRRPILACGLLGETEDVWTICDGAPGDAPGFACVYAVGARGEDDMAALSGSEGSEVEDGATSSEEDRDEPGGPATAALSVPLLTAPVDRATARSLGMSQQAARDIMIEGERRKRERALRRQKRQEEEFDQALVDVAQPVSASRRGSDAGGHRMKRAEVNRALETLRLGDVVRVHWARQGKRDQLAGVWYGRVTDIRGTRVSMRFGKEECPFCLAPRELEDVDRTLPEPETVYFAISPGEPPLSAPCACEPIDLDDERPFDFVGDVAVPGDPDISVAMRSIDAQCVANGRLVDSSQLRGHIGRSWYVFSGRPESVHPLVWRQLAESTRASHRRWLLIIRGMAADLRERPLAQAVVETILRLAAARRWRWSTVASALSACASALANLTLYTSEGQNVNLRADPYYVQAMKRAQHLARVNTAPGNHSTALSPEQLSHLTGSQGIKAARPRLLLLMTWHFAARVGDMREVRPCDIEVRGSEMRSDGFVPVRVRFNFGKGAAFWGPYTIHSLVPPGVAKEIVAIMQSEPADKAIFTLHDQAALSSAVASELRHPSDAPRLNLRSIRRGALLALAAKGATDDELQLLSGHKRRDTLMRYLGWAAESASAKAAALARHARSEGQGDGDRRGAEDDDSESQEDDPVGAGVLTLPQKLRPPKMGPYSGYTGLKGRRVSPPPSFFPLKVPSREACGVRGDDEAAAAYPLHIKDTTRVDWKAVSELARGGPLESHIRNAEAWCTTATFYGGPVTDDPLDVPRASFNDEQLRALLAANKIVAYNGPVHGYVMAFTVAQHTKKRLRVIAEPDLNRRCDKEQAYQVHYPSRLERRARAVGARFSAELDFSAYFDQFDLSPAVQGYFVLRSKTPVDGHHLFALTRMPMGASFAPSVAQAVTSTLVFPLLSMEEVKVDTMIDNIRIVATTKNAFVKAMRTLLGRVRRANITLNDAHQYAVSDDELARKFAVTDEPRVFLGEKYLGETVCNSDNAVEKLEAAYARYLEGGPAYTKRHFASFIGLALFMAHTINVPLTELHTLLRAYGRVIADEGGWDTACVIDSEAVHVSVERLTDRLLQNAPVPLPRLHRPEQNLDAYDAAIEVDASCTAWGACVRFARTGEVWQLQQRWTTPVSHSAHAEPRAAQLALRWTRGHAGYENARIALITDHVAIATGQRRWYSNNGGFSTSFHLNEVFRELYDHGGGEVFHVEGVRNEADQLSRDPYASTTLRATRAKVSFKELGSLRHPYLSLRRFSWQV